MEKWSKIKNSITNKFEKTPIEKESSSLEKLEKLFSNGTLFTNEEGKKYILQNGSRIAVIANINGAKIPFYQSVAGTDGKNTGKWYPFFSNKGGRLIKGSIEDMNEGYHVPEIKKMMCAVDTEISDYLYNTILSNHQTQVFSSSTWKNQVGNIKEVKEQNPEFIIHPTEAGEYMAKILKYSFEKLDLKDKADEALFLAEKINEIKTRLYNAK